MNNIKQEIILLEIDMLENEIYIEEQQTLLKNHLKHSKIFPLAIFSSIICGIIFARKKNILQILRGIFAGIHKITKINRLLQSIPTLLPYP